MADDGWDNSGLPAAKGGMPTWGKVLLGCGAAFLLATGTCVAGSLFLANRIKKDPEGFKKAILGQVKRFMEEDWSELRRCVDQLGSEEGAQALYRTAPGLAASWPTEESFLSAARGWRPLLEPVPAEIPDLEGHDLGYHDDLRGRMRLSYRLGNGTRVELTWKGGHQKGVPRVGQLVEIRVSPGK